MTSVWSRNLRDEDDCGFDLDCYITATPANPWHQVPPPVAASFWPVAAALSVPDIAPRARRNHLLTGSASASARQRTVVPTQQTQDVVRFSQLPSDSAAMSVPPTASHRSPLKNLSPFQTGVTAVSPPSRNSHADRTDATQRPYLYPPARTCAGHFNPQPSLHSESSTRIDPIWSEAHLSKVSAVLRVEDRSQHPVRTTWSSLSTFSQSMPMSLTPSQPATAKIPRFNTQNTPSSSSTPLEQEVVAPTPIRLTPPTQVFVDQNSATAVPCAAPNRLEQSAPNPSWLEEALYGPPFGADISSSSHAPVTGQNRVTTRKAKVSRFKRIGRVWTRKTTAAPAPAHTMVAPYPHDGESKPSSTPQTIRRPFKQRGNRRTPPRSSQA
ncbi:BQ5605_C005g03366 [Microbotryum silenes-dioicae]|uniref:BQ5605_C005g03366 protein n=1 Tax=Microbotryum silenes-dioicae TaxID=796604 RepID=A0A2X0N4H8_9BASI|nr:BQ5605_C005g03366 [Microbotryum silenes-dioicae]